ncbi:hypothetical protein [Streptomyces noursei]
MTIHHAATTLLGALGLLLAGAAPAAADEPAPHGPITALGILTEATSSLPAGTVPSLTYNGKGLPADTGNGTHTVPISH